MNTAQLHVLVLLGAMWIVEDVHKIERSLNKREEQKYKNIQQTHTARGANRVDSMVHGQYQPEKTRDGKVSKFDKEQFNKHIHKIDILADDLLFRYSKLITKDGSIWRPV